MFFADLRMNECNVLAIRCAVQFCAESLLCFSPTWKWMSVMFDYLGLKLIWYRIFARLKSLVCCINVLCVLFFLIFVNLRMNECDMMFDYPGVQFNSMQYLCSPQIVCLLYKCRLCFVLFSFSPTWEWMSVMFWLSWRAVQFYAVSLLASHRLFAV